MSGATTIRWIAAPAVVAVSVLGSCTGDDVPESGRFRVELSGEAVSGGRADRNGSATMSLKLDAAEPSICYRVEVSGLDAPTVAHIHRATDDGGDPAVVRVFRGAELTGVVSGKAGAAGDLAYKGSGCNKDVRRTTLEDVLADPDAFYVDIHNTRFPRGALAADLQDLHGTLGGIPASVSQMPLCGKWGNGRPLAKRLASLQDCLERGRAWR